MEVNIEEALRAKAYAEKKFYESDFAGARSYALKAQKLCPELEGVDQMVATYGVYIASELKINGEFDFYSILGLDPSVDKSKLKKQYKKMAVLLHPDKNKTAGADGAFRLISEAWTLLSDSVKRSAYDHRRNLAAGHTAGAGYFVDNSYSKTPASHARLDTFWTVCTSCHVQYEYLRKYVNKRLSCKNCRGVFIAVETGAAPIYCTYSYVPENGYGSHGCGVTYVPPSTAYCTSNGVSGHHSGHGSEYASNASFQWGSYPSSSAGIIDLNGFSATINHQANERGNKTKVKHQTHKFVVDTVSNGFATCSEPRPSRPGRPPKKRKVDVGSASPTGIEEVSANIAAEPRVAVGNGNLKNNSKLSSQTEASTRRCPAAPAFDARPMLINKARTEIQKKLQEMKLASEETERKRRALAEIIKSNGAPETVGLTYTSQQPELKKLGSMPIMVPDSDFHDFDKDRSEECFKPKQIWALYDEEDGMPRLYCLIRQIVSLKPFKIYISYLSSKTDTEFGSVNWLDSGFTKSCGSFRVFHSEIVEQVNIFSHLLSREKAGRGGCVRIYPRSGDVWAVYRNWSSDWNRKTPDEVRHQYEMVEVLDDYCEDFGVYVSPLIKLDGYKTVYQRNTNKDAIRLIPRREMLRFSHQVPSCLLKGEIVNLYEDCWDLDPAATPDELLQGATEPPNEANPGEAEISIATGDDQHQTEIAAVHAEEKVHSETLMAITDNCSEAVGKVQAEGKIQGEDFTRTPGERSVVETSVQA